MADVLRPSEDMLTEPLDIVEIVGQHEHVGVWKSQVPSDWHVDFDCPLSEQPGWHVNNASVLATTVDQVMFPFENVSMAAHLTENKKRGIYIYRK